MYYIYKNMYIMCVYIYVVGKIKCIKEISIS